MQKTPYPTRKNPSTESLLTEAEISAAFDMIEARLRRIRHELALASLPFEARQPPPPAATNVVHLPTERARRGSRALASALFFAMVVPVTERACALCTFYRPPVPDGFEPLVGGPVGECRRRPPGARGWPEVRERDWCGSFEPEPALQ